MHMDGCQNPIKGLDGARPARSTASSQLLAPPFAATPPQEPLGGGSSGVEQTAARQHSPPESLRRSDAGSLVWGKGVGSPRLVGETKERAVLTEQLCPRARERWTGRSQGRRVCVCVPGGYRSDVKGSAFSSLGGTVSTVTGSESTQKSSDGQRATLESPRLSDSDRLRLVVSLLPLHPTALQCPCRLKHAAASYLCVASSETRPHQVRPRLCRRPFCSVTHHCKCGYAQGRASGIWAPERASRLCC
ncbi:hypothetical protein GGR56DRAFT_267253 [Xylariaceae sp. FL0804]|nr:hypothetical protein GGR56DRAFT_267253 [Xylariaceae sp. FL0804]